METDELEVDTGVVDEDEVRRVELLDEDELAWVDVLEVLEVDDAGADKVDVEVEKTLEDG